MSRASQRRLDILRYVQNSHRLLGNEFDKDEWLWYYLAPTTVSVLRSSTTLLLIFWDCCQANLPTTIVKFRQSHTSPTQNYEQLDGEAKQ